MIILSKYCFHAFIKRMQIFIRFVSILLDLTYFYSKANHFLRHKLNTNDNLNCFFEQFGWSLKLSSSFDGRFYAHTSQQSLTIAYTRDTIYILLLNYHILLVPRTVSLRFFGSHVNTPVNRIDNIFSVPEKCSSTLYI